MKKKAKEFFQNQYGKLCVASASLTCALASMMGTVFAASSDVSTVTAAFQTGFQQVVTDATGLIAAAVPIALGLAGTIFIVRKAMSWFKSIAK